MFPGNAGSNDDDDTIVSTAVASAASASAKGDREAGLAGAKQSGEGTGPVLGQRKGGNSASEEAVAARPAVPAVSESVHESSMSRDELLAQVSHGRTVMKTWSRFFHPLVCFVHSGAVK